MHVFDGLMCFPNALLIFSCKIFKIGICLNETDFLITFLLPYNTLDRKGLL